MNDAITQLPPLRPLAPECQWCGTRSQVAKREIARGEDGEPISEELCIKCNGEIEP